MKLENKSYSRLVKEGFIILPPGTDMTAYCKQELEEAGFVIIHANELNNMVLVHISPGTGLVIGDGASDNMQDSTPENARLKIAGTNQPIDTFDDEEPIVIQGYKVGAPEKHKKSKTSTKHPLADFERKSLEDGTVNFRIGELEAWGSDNERIAVEILLNDAFDLRRAGKTPLEFVEGLPEHENRTLVLGILKPEGEAKQ